MRERRRTWMKSSGRRSFHQRVTSALLLKKRCPPMSKRYPSWQTVRDMPPTYSGSFSRTVTFQPASTASKPAVRPAGPAPTIRTRPLGCRSAERGAVKGGGDGGAALARYPNRPHGTCATKTVAKPGAFRQAIVDEMALRPRCRRPGCGDGRRLDLLAAPLRQERVCQWITPL